MDEDSSSRLKLALLLGLTVGSITRCLFNKGALKGRVNGAYTVDRGRYYVRRFHDPL